MKPYCEIVAQNLLPTIRAMIAKELMEKYKFNQQDVASKLGLTQSAVSQYVRNLRGSASLIQKDQQISREIEDFAQKLASGELNSASGLEQFCSICRAARRSEIICKMHKKISPELKNCSICTK